jgi:hypothetical protein
MASSLRDAPYAGLFLVIYEGLKREACRCSFPCHLSASSLSHVIAFLIPQTTQAEATAIHGLSAAAAGTVATLITHPFDVIKVLDLHCPPNVRRRLSNFVRPKFKFAPKTNTAACGEP